MNTLNIDWKPFPTQIIAWNYLLDDEKTEILYGGAAGGGKTYLGCSWALYNALNYKGSRGLIGRNELKRLKESTLLTLFDIARSWGLVQNTHFKYNSIEGVIKFINGSAIYLSDLSWMPSDPEYERLGSTEYTWAFIDEAGEIEAKAKDIVKTRIRYKLTEFNLKPKLLMTCNPTQNWIYSNFYKPWTQKTLLKHRAFIQSFAKDNVYNSEAYLESLDGLDDEVTKRRLRDGDWDYISDDNALFRKDGIIDMFNSGIQPNMDPLKAFLSIDVARKGKDRTAFCIWHGDVCFINESNLLSTSSIDEIVEKAKFLCRKENIPRSHVVIDEDGVGGGVVDYLTGCYGFVNNSRQIRVYRSHKHQTNYSNLKTQCYFAFSKAVKERKIRIIASSKIREELAQELAQIRQKDIDKEG